MFSKHATSYSAEVTKRHKTCVGVIKSQKGPATPRFATMSKRLESFKHWPQALVQCPEELAEAGFIYQGIGDHVQCFYCNGGLKNWDPEDSPWGEHARWFGNCAFLLLKLGTDFVSWVKTNKSLSKKEVDNTAKEVMLSQTLPRVPGVTKAKDGSSENYLAKLREENSQLVSRNACKVCGRGHISVLLKPCFHLAVCSNCAPDLRKCCQCGEAVQETVKVYI